MFGKMASVRVVFSVFLLFSASSLFLRSAESASLETINNAFPHDGFAYDIAENTQACGKAVEVLKYNSSISNYGQVISAKLKLLSKKGGWLKIHPGVYPVSSTISIPSRVCFAGTHASKVILEAQIPPENGSSVISLKEVTKVAVFNITLVNNATNSIYIKDSTYVLINRVDATGASGSNLYITGGQYHAVYWGAFGGCKSDCVSIVNSNRVAVVHSAISDCGKHGIRVGGSGYVRLAQCSVNFGDKASNNSCAISVSEQGGKNTSALLVTDNDLHDARRGGVCGRRTKTLIIEDNDITSDLWKEADCIIVNELIDEMEVLGNYCDNSGFSSF